MKKPLLIMLVALGALSGVAMAQDSTQKQSSWLPTLTTATPEEGFDLAVRMARTGVRLTQPDVEVLQDLRTVYAHDPDSLTAASQVIAIHFQTIAAANEYWRTND